MDPDVDTEPAIFVIHLQDVNNKLLPDPEPDPDPYR
jgi:hypothetical protein